MSIGYPGRKRARHAFERGVRDGYTRKRKPNPYLNEWMIDLYERGFAEGMKGREPLPQKPKPVKKSPPPASRYQGRGSYRSFSNPPRRGGGWR